MSMTQVVYKFNAPRMIHETIEKETVVIDTETGIYFSITGSGYLIMQMLDQGAHIADLAAQVAATFGIDAASLHPHVEDFVAQLLTEEMIVPTEEAPGAVAALVFADGEGYVPPVLEKFTDMNDLLLMDPIHDVSDEGWPRRA